MSFCRTNLFKRLESGGPALIQLLEVSSAPTPRVPFFVVGLDLVAFLSRGDRTRVFASRKEDGAVMAEFAPIAPHKVKKRVSTRSIQPRQRLSLGTVNFLIAALNRAVSPGALFSSLAHEK
jgi:hypothetical protein